MNEANYTIRTMRREEVNLAVEWAALEGWNPGLHDAESFHAADPGGFLVGLLDGEAVATLSAVRYGRDFGFMGFYIVKPGHRGRGFGLRLWNAGLDQLAGRNIGLDGVIAQLANYRKCGFKLAYRNIRFEGNADAATGLAPEIVPLATRTFHELEHYDRRFFPADRRAFLQSWIDQPGSRALGFVEGGVLAGYGVIRPCRHGSKVGPLFADHPEAADSLFSALTAGLESAIFLDVPEVNPAAVALAERNGMSVVFETARMYTGAAPPLALDGIFGVTSFELG